MENEGEQWYSEQPQGSGYNEPSLQPISWSASEFVSHQKSANWYILLGVGSAVITVIIFIISRNLLSGIVIALACMALGMFAAKKPTTRTYEISMEGITIDAQFYSYSVFKSFSVVQDGAVSCIWLRPLKRFLPTVVMYYDPADAERIELTLDNFLPQEDRQHDMIDRVSRRIRF